MFEQYVSKIIRGKGREDERAELVALLSDSAGSLMDGGMDEAAAQAEAIRRFEADADFQRLYLVRPWLTSRRMTLALVLGVLFFLASMVTFIAHDRYVLIQSHQREWDFDELLNEIAVVTSYSQVRGELNSAEKSMIDNVAEWFLPKYDIAYVVLFYFEGDLPDLSKLNADDAVYVYGDTAGKPIPPLENDRGLFMTPYGHWYFTLYFNDPYWNEAEFVTKYETDSGTVEHHVRRFPWSMTYRSTETVFLYVTAWVLLVLGNGLFALWADTKLRRLGRQKWTWTLSFIIFNYHAYWVYLLVHRGKSAERTQNYV
ncbi:hypothetical protein LJC55_00830 [Eubacteriales bacterium OttesenSCG-928-N14]|nr:hypothetical protein [Eubacteriales bacterium OttesenSCG-928-N14]